MRTVLGDTEEVGRVAKSRSSNRGGRALSTPYIPSAKLRLPVLSPLPSMVSPQSLLDLDDRRLYQPDRSTRLPAASRRSAARVVADPHAIHRLQFADPQRVVICARRKIRKEVLHALKRTRKGAGAKHRRKNFWSAIKC